MASRDDLARAEEQWMAGDRTTARAVLDPLVAADDDEASITLAALLMTDAETAGEGLSLLRRTADGGSGHAAHNLAVALNAGLPNLPADPALAQRYFQQAVESGFEASVSSDPYWWARDGK
jgi:hypothetical protein